MCIVHVLVCLYMFVSLSHYSLVVCTLNKLHVGPHMFLLFFLQAIYALFRTESEMVDDLKLIINVCNCTLEVFIILSTLPQFF